MVGTRVGRSNGRKARHSGWSLRESASSETLSEVCCDLRQDALQRADEHLVDCERARAHAAAAAVESPLKRARASQPSAPPPPRHLPVSLPLAEAAQRLGLRTRSRPFRRERRLARQNGTRETDEERAERNPLNVRRKDLGGAETAGGDRWLHIRFEAKAEDDARASSAAVVAQTRRNGRSSPCTMEPVQTAIRHMHWPHAPISFSIVSVPRCQLFRISASAVSDNRQTKPYH
eukprot:6205951-Pleurochrysis_carterae.AAC.2